MKKPLPSTLLLILSSLALTFGFGFFCQLVFDLLSFSSPFTTTPYLLHFALIVTLIPTFLNGLAMLVEGKKFAKSNLGAKQILPNHGPLEETKYYSMTQSLCEKFRRPMPAIYIVEAEELNAFNLGLTPQSQQIIITSGLLKTLKRRELVALLTYQLKLFESGSHAFGIKVAVIMSGYFQFFIMGLRMFQASQHQVQGEKEGPDYLMMLVSSILLTVGFPAWILGSLYKYLITSKYKHPLEIKAETLTLQSLEDPSDFLEALEALDACDHEDLPKRAYPYSHLALQNQTLLCGAFPYLRSIKDRIAHAKHYLQQKQASVQTK